MRPEMAVDMVMKCVCAVVGYRDGGGVKNGSDSENEWAGETGRGVAIASILVK